MNHGLLACDSMQRPLEVTKSTRWGKLTESVLMIRTHQVAMAIKSTSVAMAKKKQDMIIIM